MNYLLVFEGDWGLEGDEGRAAPALILFEGLGVIAGVWL